MLNEVLCTVLEAKPRPWGYNWPKGKKCEHPRTVEVTSSAGWGCPYDRIKTICRQCGKVLSVRPIS